MAMLNTQMVTGVFSLAFYPLWTGDVLPLWALWLSEMTDTEDWQQVGRREATSGCSAEGTVTAGRVEGSDHGHH